MNYFTSNLIYILQMLISIYIYVLLLRVILQKLSANYYNPVIQLIVKITDPVVKPTRKILPFIKGYDLACVLLLVILQLVNIFLSTLVLRIGMPAFFGFILILIGELGRRLIYLYITAIIIQAVMSWLPNLNRNPASELIYLLCNPIMRRIHRVIPPISGIDFSPMIVLVVLYLVNTFVFYPLIYTGFGLR